MAGDTASLGKMVVDLLLEDAQFKSALGSARKSMAAGGADLGRMATQTGAQITSAFKIATAAIVAFGAASTVVGANFEQQMAMVGALQGLKQTDQAFQDLEAQARMLGSTTEFTATQAASALEDLARAGATVEESIASSNAALLLAGTSAASLSDSTQLLVATQRQFGLEAKESERITNVFSLAMRKSLLDFTSVREAMKFAGTAGAAFGMTLEETTASVAAFRDMGLEGSLAGTNFRMALIAAAQGTDKQNAALKKYGLTVRDINPEQNTFIDIVEKMGAVSLTATDAVQIFGSRAGANIAQLAAETAKGNVNMREMTNTLLEASAAGNTAADMYDTIGQTVSFASKVALSALQDLMIELFQTFAGPLRTLIETLPVVLNTVTSALKAQAPAIRQAFGSTLEGIAKFLKENADDLADAFINTAKAIADLGPVLLAVAKVLIVMAKNADILIGALAFGSVVVVALKMAMAFNAIAIAIGGAQTAVVVFGTTLTVTTGGLFAAVVAVGVLVAAFVALASSILGARGETERLNAANEKLTDAEARLHAAREEQAGIMLKRQQATALQRLRTEELSDAETQRLQRLLELTAAEARQLEAEGKLIVTGGELHEVGELINKMGADAITFLDGETAGMDRSVAAIDEKIVALELLQKNLEVSNSTVITGEKLKEAALVLGVQEVKNLEELQATLTVLSATREQTAARAKALRNEVSSHAQGKIKADVAAEFDAAREINIAKGQASDGGDDLVDKREDQAEATLGIATNLAAEIQALTMTEEELQQVAQDKRLAKIAKAFDAEAALYEGNAEKIEEINGRKNDALALSNELFNKKRSMATAASLLQEEEAFQAHVDNILADIAADTPEGGPKGLTAVAGRDLEADATDALISLADSIPFIGGILSGLLEIALNYDDVVEGLFNAVFALPESIGSSFERFFREVIPDIITHLDDFLVDLLVKLPLAIFKGIVIGIPQIITAVAVLIKELIIELPRQIANAFFEVGKEIVEAFAVMLNPFKKKDKVKGGEAVSSGRVFFSPEGGLTRAGAKALADERAAAEAEAEAAAAGSAFSGISYVPATMRMTVHQGEAVVDAARNAQRVDTGAPAAAGAAQNGLTGGAGGQGQTIEVAVFAEGRLFEAVLLQAGERGTAVGLKKVMRRASGVRIGIDRGRFNPFT